MLDTARHACRHLRNASATNTDQHSFVNLASVRAHAATHRHIDGPTPAHAPYAPVLPTCTQSYPADETHPACSHAARSQRSSRDRPYPICTSHPDAPPLTQGTNASESAPTAHSHSISLPREHGRRRVHAAVSTTGREGGTGKARHAWRRADPSALATPSALPALRRFPPFGRTHRRDRRTRSPSPSGHAPEARGAVRLCACALRYALRCARCRAPVRCACAQRAVRCACA